MPPAPARFPQRPVLFPPSPVGKRRAGGGGDDAAVGESKTKTSAVSTSKGEKKVVSAKKDAAFSELIGDLLKENPLPFIKDA